MRHALALLTLPFAAASLVPAAASARPITAGVNLGFAQSKIDGQAGSDPNRTLGLFGRLGFSKRVAGQLEVARVETDDAYVDIRTLTAALVVDLGGSGRLIPTLIAGLGLDDASTSYGVNQQAHHIEGGLGLEYRADGGLTIGADLRIGSRTLDQSEQPIPLAEGDVKPQPGIAYYVPSTLQDGEYRSFRVTAGVRF